MLIKKTVFSILVLIISCFSIKAQDFEVPKKYKFKNETDYKAEESNIVKAVDWLLATPLHKEEKKRANVNAYLMKWLTGTPTFTLTVLPDAIPYMSDCPPCLMLYMGYWAKVSIETDNNNSSSEYSLAWQNQIIRKIDKAGTIK